MSIEAELYNLNESELRQLVHMLSSLNPQFEKELFNTLTLIRANKRARSRG